MARSRAEQRMVKARRDWHGRDMLERPECNPVFSKAAPVGNDWVEAQLVCRLAELGQLDAALNMLERCADASASAHELKNMARALQADMLALGVEDSELSQLIGRLLTKAAQLQESARLARADSRWLIDQTESGRRYRRGPALGPAKVWLSNSLGSALEHGEALDSLSYAGGCQRREFGLRDKAAGECRGLVCTKGTVVDTTPNADKAGSVPKTNRRTTRGKGRKCRK